TIWRWGRQNAPKRGKPLGSYELWALWVRDPLLALGCKDPVARVSEIKARDPERQQVAELFALWWEHHRDDPVRVAGLYLDVIQVIDPTHKRGRQYHATRVKNLVGTRQGGYRLERVREPSNARKMGVRYRLIQNVPVTEKASASSASSAPDSETSDNST